MNFQNPISEAVEIIRLATLYIDDEIWLARAEKYIKEHAPHNHITRDIKPPGQCLACDEIHKQRLV